MKHYKQKQRELEDKKRQPTLFDRNQELFRITRLIARDTYLRHWSEGKPFAFGHFMAEFSQTHNHDKTLLTYDDISKMYPVYKEMFYHYLRERKKKEFLKNNYKPIEEELFKL